MRYLNILDLPSLSDIQNYSSRVRIEFEEYEVDFYT